MALTSIYPNHWQEERVAAGFTTPEALASAASLDPEWFRHIESGEILPTLAELDRLVAALGDIPRERLYQFGLVNTIGGTQPADHPPDYAKFYGARVEIEHLFVSKDEIAWLEKDETPDRTVDVFVNMSCGPMEVPHLLLNTVSVFDTLGVNYQAGAGRIVCCGTYYRGNRNTDAGYRMHDASVGRSVAWGAKTTVHWCTQCQNTFNEVARRRELAATDEPRLRNVQLLSFLEERLLALGDRVPWKKRVAARVMVQGSDVSPVHAAAKRKVADVLRLVPGVTVVGFTDLPDGQGKDAPRTAEGVRAKRAELAEIARRMGADTLSPQHHNGQKFWSRFSSETVAVRHTISILAEALGCERPDRYQAAHLLGDPDAVVAQLRPVWSTWGMTDEKAGLLARELFSPAYAAGPSRCTCGSETGCREGLISVDVLQGSVRRPASAAH